MIHFKELDEYGEQEFDYEPLRIVGEVVSPISTTDFIYFDGILSYAVWHDVMREEAYSIPESKEDVFYIPLPIKQSGNTEKFYHASVGFFDDKVEGLARWRKQVSIETNKKIFVGRGIYRRYDTPIPYIYADKIYFYVNGDKREVQRLLDNYILSIGKKRTQGYGNIRKWTVESINEDMSIIDKDGNPMRPIPVSSDVKVNTRNAVTILIAYRPPYWHYKNMTQCYVNRVWLL